MKRSVLAIAAIAMAVCLAFALTGCGSSNYTPELKKQAIDDSALVKKGTLTVGVNAVSAPYATESTDGKTITGFDVDIAAALADELGLKLEIVNVGELATSALEGKQVDIVMGLSSEKDAKYWQSNPYSESAVALFAAQDNTTVPTKASNPQVAAQTSSKSAWAVTNQFGASSLNSVKGIEDAFTSLADGKVQYVAADAVIGTYAAEINNNSCHIVALMEEPQGRLIGVNNENTLLKTEIAGAIEKIIGNGVRDGIQKYYLGTVLQLADIPRTAESKATIEETKTDVVVDDVQHSTSEAGANAVQF